MASYPQDRIGIGDRVTWYGNTGTVVAYIPPHMPPATLLDALMVKGEMKLMFDDSKVRDVTSYIIRKDQTTWSKAKPELYRPFGKTIKLETRRLAS